MTKRKYTATISRSFRPGDSTNPSICGSFDLMQRIARLTQHCFRYIEKLILGDCPFSCIGVSPLTDIQATWLGNLLNSLKQSSVYLGTVLFLILGFSLIMIKATWLCVPGYLRSYYTCGAVVWFKNSITVVCRFQMIRASGIDTSQTKSAIAWIL